MNVMVYAAALMVSLFAFFGMVLRYESRRANHEPWRMATDEYERHLQERCKR